MIQAVSFDVFDTLLTRVVAPPTAAFLVMGRRAASAGFVEANPEAFARARIRAEAMALRNAGELYTLARIYDELGAALRLTPLQRDELMDLEMALEVELLRPVPGGLAGVLTAREQGKRVVFVSDTYLPAAFVQEQLDRHGFWQHGDACYVSCASGKTKRAGALFQEVLEQEELASTSVRHVGNDLQSDVRSAKRAGMRTEHVAEGNLNRYEQLLASHCWSTVALSAAMSGASRLARLSTRVQDARQAALRDVAAGVVAPTLVGFVLWVLQQARQRSLDRLYFVARDGQILRDIAHRLIEKLHLSCEIRYIYGSRQAWNLPALAAMEEDELARSLNGPSWIWDSTHDLSAQSVLARANIHPEELSDQLESARLTEDRWNQAMNPDEHRALRRVFQEEAVRDLLIRKAETKRTMLLGYLAQEGLLEPCAFGLVDLAGYGTLHDSLAAVLRATGREPPVGLYFGLLNGSNDLRHGDRTAYLYDERSCQGFTGTYRDWGVIPLEVFCAADHGTLVGYEMENGRIQPVLTEAHNGAVTAWGLPTIRETVDTFVDHLLLEPTMLYPWADMRYATADLLTSFWRHPSRAEAEAWSAFPWEDGQGHATQRMPLAEGYRWRHVVRSLVKARVARHHRASWFAGSAALSTPAIRFAMKSLELAERIARDRRRRSTSRPSRASSRWATSAGSRDDVHRSLGWKGITWFRHALRGDL